MITGDLGRVLGVDAAGTWRPPPGGACSVPGTYASSLPLRIAGQAGEPPSQVAAALAARLRSADWVTSATVTGTGYLTVTVAAGALTALAVRVPAAGEACVASDALRGRRVVAPPADSLASAASWPAAWQAATAAVTARLAAAAGAQIIRSQPHAAGQRQTAAQAAGMPRAAVAAAVAAAGEEAVRYALTRVTAGRAGEVSAGRCARNGLENPFFVVRYAHSRASSVLRWAAGLGLRLGDPGAARPGLLVQPAELGLLEAISWLPERIAAAARRGRPDTFARCLEDLAGRWLDCAESCPALAFGGRAAPAGSDAAVARLWLAAAAQTALAACLQLAALGAPQRL